MIDSQSTSSGNDKKLPGDPVVVAALYHFLRFPDYRQWQQTLLDCCLEHDLRGTLLLADEGVNGTVAGSRQGIDALLALLRADPRFADLEHKESFADQQPFYRMKVRLKKEIVTMGVPGTDPENIVGTYLDADEWNEMISDPDVLVVDTRNDYEVEIGTFKNAVSPNTKTFREFPGYVASQLGDNKQRKVAMFCTGGIRCEKATSYLKAEGFAEVFHLRGGILKYLETVEPEKNLWEGECFVFDGRVSVDKNLQPGSYDQCHACRRPISQADMASEDYRPGVSCPHCVAEVSEEQKERFAERHRQVQLAKARGEQHIGLPSTPGPGPRLGSRPGHQDE